ncbi:branched-chain amino acid ABC transporter permease [Catellatospora vulcania]|uniref:branched-chain amino acid ABC transporter permease n=1 Tax=Catellatospora vulcania TaxID=1460450 RepID=UPI0012D3EBD2|nr:branched-chain amino acid ABC transporter permease [Catellatospora vulcania]
MLQVLWNGIFVGSFYALVALGYGMVYGVIRLLNFAHGDLYMVGAFVGFISLSALGVRTGGVGIPLLILTLVATMLVTGLLGVALERLAYRPLRGSSRLSLLITAVGASFALEYGVRIVAGADPQVYPVRFDLAALEVLGVRLSGQQLALIGFALALMVALHLLVSRTRRGRAMRAIALDPRASALMGIDVNAVVSQTFFIGSALAGAAGFMAGAYYGKIDFLMGFVIGLKAFTAAVIGGIGNIYGTMAGGILLGLVESVGTSVLGGQWRDVLTFGVLILFLSIRPTGLWGAPVAERA